MHAAALDPVGVRIDFLLMQQPRTLRSAAVM